MATLLFEHSIETAQTSRIITMARLKTISLLLIPVLQQQAARACDSATRAVTRKVFAKAPLAGNPGKNAMFRGFGPIRLETSNPFDMYSKTGANDVIRNPTKTEFMPPPTMSADGVTRISGI